MNKPRKIGTAAETATVNAALDAGVTAYRVALRGIHDQGDVWLEHKGRRVVVECKAGHKAEAASRPQILAWFADTEAEAARVPGADAAVLVVKKQGKGQARDWRAFTLLGDLLWLGGGEARRTPAAMVEVTFGEFLDMMTAGSS